jgi:2-polyprenyl-3-methyl-5-hydroxy-6-metoxy-1,4-benzoquinol methylase
VAGYGIKQMNKILIKTGEYMYKEIEQINKKPKPFEYYTAEELWTNEHTAQQMLQYHLHEEIDAASRNRAFIERSVEWIVGKFDLGKGNKVADFGCGPGLYATRLAEKGAGVTGIDFSANSLEHARKVASEKGLDVNYVHSNYLEFDTEDRFDLIIMIMCDFCALSPEQRGKLLKKFSILLKPGGSVLLDVYSLNFFDQKEEAAVYEKNQLGGFWSPDDYYGFLNSFKYEDEKVILDKYTIIEETRTREVFNWLQCYSLEALKSEFKANGFNINEMYSSVAGDKFSEDSTEIAVEVRKEN